MTDDERDVLRRCRKTVEADICVSEHNDEKPSEFDVKLLADIDRLFAADEEGKYQEEAEDVLNRVVRRGDPIEEDIHTVAAWLKARDARRKEAGK